MQSCARNDHGCILGHTMGLGKTLTAIAFIEFWLSERITSESYVWVVAPKSVVISWQNEYEKWNADIRLNFDPTTYVCVDKRPTTWDTIKNCRVIVMSYNFVKQSHDMLARYSPSLIICDEGHVLKNAKMGAPSLKGLHPRALKFILTGTPFQNTLTELFYLVEFVCPNLTSYLEQHRDYFLRLETSETDGEQIEIAKRLSKALGAAMQIKSAANFHSTLRAIKIELTIPIRLSVLQDELYRLLLRAWKDDGDVLALQSWGRDIWNHPKLLYRKLEQTKTLREKYYELYGVLQDEPPLITTDDGSNYGGKFAVALNIAETAISNDEQCLIISHSVTCLNELNIVCSNLEERIGRPLIIKKFTGEETNRSRADTMSSVEIGVPDIVLLSTKAGGVGVNLNGLTRVILMDVSWNPADDEQAIARAFRRTSTKNVFVYRLIAEGTMERVIWNRQRKKLALGKSIEPTAALLLGAFSLRDHKEVFYYNPPGPAAVHISSTALVANDPITLNLFQKCNSWFANTPYVTQSRPDS